MRKQRRKKKLGFSQKIDMARLCLAARGRRAVSLDGSLEFLLWHGRALRHRVPVLICCLQFLCFLSFIFLKLSDGMGVPSGMGCACQPITF